MKVKKISNDMICVRIEKGEDVNSVLEGLAENGEMHSATITGIGVIENVKLGFFNREKGEYSSKLFEGDFELVSCQGNITWLDGKPFAHLHAVISDDKFQTFGGHLFSCEVAVTCEFFIRICDKKVERVKEGALGLLNL